ncbi:MAG: hypothetical protein AAFZ07_19955 [Actinomycetota bacterium]
MKKLLLVVLALAAGGMVVGASPDAVVDAAQNVVGAVNEESGEIGAEREIERELDGLLRQSLSPLDEPVCDAQAMTGGDTELRFSSVECRVATLEHGAVEISAQLRGGRPVLLLTDADTTQFLGTIDDPSMADWLPLGEAPTG